MPRSVISLFGLVFGYNSAIYTFPPTALQVPYLSIQVEELNVFVSVRAKHLCSSFVRPHQTHVSEPPFFVRPLDEITVLLC